MFIWVKNEKYKMPNDYAWEYHNPVAFEEAVAAEKSGKVGAIEEYHQRYRESVEQREERWERKFIEQALNLKNISDFQEWKQNPKEFFHKMQDLGRMIGKHWAVPPEKMTGPDAIQIQNLDGSWTEQYKPVKTTRLNKWLDNHKHLPDEPPQHYIEISEQVKKENTERFWDWMYQITDNFGKGFKVAQTLPGQGQSQVPQKYRYDINV
jgi:hypothetical protein